MLYQVYSESENEGELALMSVHSKKSVAMKTATAHAPDGWKIKYLAKESALDVADFWGEDTVVVEQAENVWI